MATLTHLVASDGWYLSYFREQPAPIDEASSVTLADLRAAIAANGAVWRDILAGDPDPEADLVERGDGWEFHQPAGLRLAQAIHHGTDHRSQVCTALTSHGIEPPAIDLWAYGEATGRTRAIEAMTIRLFYDRWPQYERRLVESIRDLTPEQLALRAAPEHWPVWAIASHVAGTRVYWLCHVLGEPGADTTPFADPDGAGWEDDLDHPRSADEVVGALEATFAIIDAALDRWTPEMMGDSVERSYGDVRQIHSRTSILQRLLTHEAYHGGELAIALGSHQLDPTYIWRADDPLQS